MIKPGCVQHDCEECKKLREGYDIRVTQAAEANAKLRTTQAALRLAIESMSNLAKVKGRYHTEEAFKQMMEDLKTIKGMVK